uniref:PARP catalytic domain-containing protein n=1 Tax=Oreochromis niloticus TaxID=8128 RepID=A0A669EYZ0_ORENI
MSIERSQVDCEEPKDGKTYVMYHGTTRANARSIQSSGFRQSSNGMLGRGVYLSRDLKKASRYPIGHPEHDRVVIKVQVNVGKVITINRQNHPLQKTWHDRGYDTAWVPPKCGMVTSGLEEDCVWDPKQITILETIEPKSVRDTGAGSRPISTYYLADLPEHNYYDSNDPDDDFLNEGLRKLDIFWDELQARKTSGRSKRSHDHQDYQDYQDYPWSV